ncbi:L-2-hydroxyglutarate oxidase LhgO [Breoghania corrubedonensis]|uniref:L-2-hydroxyglutarate oxidase LhgO n=1 Tax=Breoghania corrubedonensis TaxID=665038 RepID=A0A2T5V4W3_9HYPH|nr:NAD(P)/FAD-dependent oxidoreductase [Breoghania corrubedonensis]PTW58773.1 L-2-hydroxyglutarate oxidase LhgO [Breoghania corrubedonensis]
MGECVQTVIVGAGVVGLAVARALAQAGREVIVLERHGLIGSEISSRNSEVIHAGIYYDTDWLKTRLCVAGRKKLYPYLERHSVAHKKTGKLIVASDAEQLSRLSGIMERARINGVDDLRLLSAEEACEMEPHLACTGAILSPSTGIVDAHGLMLALQGDAEEAGAMVAFNAPLQEGRVGEDGIALEVGGDAPMSLLAEEVVIAAGLGAQDAAARLDGYPADEIPPIHRIKGNYFALSGKSPFEHLIYPVPVHGGLGTHATLDLSGRIKFGPDVDWDAPATLDVDPARAETFYDAVRSYWPGLPDGALAPDYAGIRPKLTTRGEPARDFVIHGPETHGVAGLVSLFGIESPGLTSSLAIADHVAHLLGYGKAQ